MQGWARCGVQAGAKSLPFPVSYRRSVLKPVQSVELKGRELEKGVIAILYSTRNQRKSEKR